MPSVSNVDQIASVVIYGLVFTFIIQRDLPVS